jgi:predicted CXXCH cytochrome family protein
LRKSACFQQSAGLPPGKAMTCTTCHDPHDIPRGEAATQHYIAACRSCMAKISKGRFRPADTRRRKTALPATCRNAVPMTW